MHLPIDRPVATDHRRSSQAGPSGEYLPRRAADERMYGPPRFRKACSVLARSRRRECIRPVGMRQWARLRPSWGQRAADLITTVGLEGRFVRQALATPLDGGGHVLPCRAELVGAGPVASGGRAIVVVAGHDRPTEAGELGGQGDRGDVGVRPGRQPLQPAAEPVVAAQRHPFQRACRVHQQPAQIAVAVPGYPEQLGLAAGAVLARDQTQPSMPEASIRSRRDRRCAGSAEGAARLRPVRKPSALLPTAATKAVASIGPTPGLSIASTGDRFPAGPDHCRWQ